VYIDYTDIAASNRGNYDVTN